MRIMHAVFAVIFSICAFAQEQTSAAPAAQQGRQDRGQRFPGARGGGGGFLGNGTSGTISEIKGNVLTLKGAEGKTFAVKIGDNARLIGKDRAQISLKDLKVGDYATAGGQPGTDGVIEARVVMLMDEEAVKRMKDAQANMGKTMIAGEVKGINETKITVQRMDGQTQVIEVDENTSLKKMGESITLADIKVGDRISGPGELKGGVFVAKELRVGQMGAGGQQRRSGQMDRPAESKPDKP
ncbi:MAG: hypothetical protein JWO13_2596 [Acidobacteriales bacterium]|nr:hypothetical protein [Terriglobales bacterium]